MRLRRLVVGLLSASLAMAGVAATEPARPAKRSPAKAKPAPVDPREEQAQQSAERARLAERIDALKKDIAAGEKSRTGAAAALARAEQALAEVDRRLAQLDSRRREAEQRALDLDRRRAGTASEIARRRADLDEVARMAYLNGYQEPLHLALTGRDPNGPLLTDAWLGDVARARLAEVGTLNDQASDLDARRRQVDAENRALAEQAEAQQSARESLASSRLAQREALTRLSQKLAQQRGTASALAADEKRLASVIDRLQKLIDRQAAEALARRELARRRAEQQAAARQKREASAPRSGGAPPPSPPPRQVEPASEPPGAVGEFAQLRGRLGFPARGALTARYGTPRGDGGASWKGIFIRTEAGAEVRAVAPGRVVFSDYLRGFGNLLIVDHGDQYLSIYGNNDTLVKHAGDAVKAAEVVARAGSSIGDQDTGLYFELRYRGKPFDPLAWIGPR